MKKLILSGLLILCLGSTCLNQSTVNNLISPSIFIVLDSYIAAQIEIAADKCFDRIDEQNLMQEESYEKWHYCMRDYYEMESILEAIKNNIEKKDKTKVRENLLLLSGLMDLIGLEMPEEVKELL